ncbi:MAG: DNA polymerase III subunit alpha, partial [Kiritimatiellae bacterium]|nr:DNA polymerase III subunit alpha [Kiritimatiellia bacterium]
QTLSKQSDENRLRFPAPEFYLKSGAEMRRLFSELPEAVVRTSEIAERCTVEIEMDKLHFPVFEVPKGTTQAEFLHQLVREGLKKKFGIEDLRHPRNEREKEIVERVEHEMRIIEKTGFVNYFLVVWDFVRFAREKNIPVGPGRGSGGGSLVAYVLGITTIDPLRFDLIFERFLNPERVSPPDFDIDFCQNHRAEVIEYVRQKYGRDNVAQIISFQTLGARAVIRDIGRVLDLPYAYCDRLSKMVPDDPKITLRKALDSSPELQDAYKREENCRKIVDYGLVLEGLPRNASTHAAGVVIGEKPLAELVPLTRIKGKEIVTQYAMEPLGKIGLLKMDFLGLKTLTVIRETVDLLRETRGIELDPDRLPLDDRITFELLSRGDTIGIFQLESDGMREVIREVGPRSLEDLMAVIALYRPGPMNMLEDYTKRRLGKAEVHYDHPLLEPILRETYGVMVYQEQVQKAASVLAGYSLGEADILRHAMGKKREAEMQKQRPRFIEGCKKTCNIDAKRAAEIFDTMARFAGYGFNKAHSAAYAVIAYQTAYLKAHHPIEFMAASLSSEMGNSDKLATLIGEALAMGIEILPPDVNASAARFRPEGNAIRFGLTGIKNVGEGAAEAIVNERLRNGPFRGLVDFCVRVDGQVVNRKVIESLVRVGAFDSINRNRAMLFNGIDTAMSRAASLLRDRRSGQTTLFSMLEPERSTAASDEALPPCSEWRQTEVLAAERELLGVYLSGHPLAQYRSLMEQYRLCPLGRLTELKDGSPTRVAGIITRLTKHLTKPPNPRPMANLVLEDLETTVEVRVFPDTYERVQDRLRPDAAVLICGEVSWRDERPQLLASEVYELAEAPRYFTEKLIIHIPTALADENHLLTVRKLLEMHSGSTPVVLTLRHPLGETVFLETDRGLTVTVTEELIRQIEKELGEKSVEVVVNRQPYRENRQRRRSGERKAARNGP